MRVYAAKPRLARPLISRNVSEWKQNDPVSFHCDPDFTISSSSSSTDLLITWYINTQPLTGQFPPFCLGSRDDHGNGIIIGNGNPIGSPREWDKHRVIIGSGMGITAIIINLFLRIPRIVMQQN